MYHGTRARVCDSSRFSKHESRKFWHASCLSQSCLAAHDASCKSFVSTRGPIWQAEIKYITSVRSTIHLRYSTSDLTLCTGAFVDSEDEEQESPFSSPQKYYDLVSKSLHTYDKDMAEEARRTAERADATKRPQPRRRRPADTSLVGSMSSSEHS